MISRRGGKGHAEVATGRSLGHSFSGRFTGCAVESSLHAITLLHTKRHRLCKHDIEPSCQVLSVGNLSTAGLTRPSGGSLSYYGCTRTGFGIPKSTAEFFPAVSQVPHRFSALLLRLISSLWYNAVQPATILDTCNQTPVTTAVAP